MSDTTSLVSISMATLAALGIGTLIYTKSQSKKQERKAKEAMMSSSRRKRRHDVDDAGSTKKKPQKVTLYFDKNDELVDEETVLKDKHNYYHKYHAVTVDFGNEEDESRGILTKDIFWGQKKTDNAQIFIENYEKTKVKHQMKMMDVDLGQSFESEESARSKIEMKVQGGDSVIMDMDPSNFEKPKDNLFFDFFSIYAKNFISDKQKAKIDGYNNNNNGGLVLIKSNTKDQNRQAE